MMRLAPLLAPLSRLYGGAWELRRSAYARGWITPERIESARVVSVGNLTVGGAGKTTLTLHLARQAAARGIEAAVVCRRYRPGASGVGDEERLYANALGAARVYAGRSKRALARRAAAAGHAVILVDDGFSHWRLERDLDVVLLDVTDPWGGGRLLPAGRLREPRRALARAEVVVVTRVPADADLAAVLGALRGYAPAALWCAARHRVVGVRAPEGEPRPERVLVATGTGNPGAVAASAREAGLEVVETAAFPDHHPFREGEAAALEARARRARARVLVTAKDAVRWPPGAESPCVLEVEWEWRHGGVEAERMIFGGNGA